MKLFVRLVQRGAERKLRAPRRQIESRLGSTVLTELSLAIATARVFPTIKRGMGFAKSCSLVDIEIEPARRA